MKKLPIFLFCIVLAATFSGCKRSEKAETQSSASAIQSSSESNLVGGWTKPENTEITDELLSLFGKASKGFTGARLEPVKLIGTQVVAGINYKFLCKSYPIEKDAKPVAVTVTVYKDLEGNAKITDIKKADADLP